MTSERRAFTERPFAFPTAIADEVIRDILDGKRSRFRLALSPQPPSEADAIARGARYGLRPRVSRGVGVYSLSDYETLPKEPGEFAVMGSLWFVRERCGQTEWTCPLGVPGDHIWVQEAWAPIGYDGFTWLVTRNGHRAIHRAGGGELPDPYESHPRWRRAIHMPRWAARLVLEVTSIGVERISERDALVEGVDPSGQPWVWVVDFRAMSGKEASS